MSLPISPAGRRYGRIKDVPDSRDRVMRFAAVPPPPSADESASLGPVRDQGQEGSCVGHGWAGHADWLFRRYGPHHFSLNLSPQFIYYLARQMEGTLPNDAGAQVRTGAKVFNQYGAAPETDDPYSLDSMNIPPSTQALSNALLYKGGAYHTLLTQQDRMLCLASGYCYVDGINVYDSFESDAVATSGEVPMPAPREQCLGGHCTLMFGYDINHKNLDGSLGAEHRRNSWGNSWGVNGDFWLPFSYVQQYAADCWVLHLGPAWK